MKMADIQAMTDDFITPAVAAEVLHMDPGRLIGYARKGELPFEVHFSGNRVKISRRGFLKAYGYLEETEEKPTAEQLMAKIIERLDTIEKLLARRPDIILAAMNGKEEAQ